MQAVADRLTDGIPKLKDRIFGAARLETLRASNALATVSPAAFVIPVGLRGGPADAVTGLFRQGLDRVVGVVLVYRHSGDATGGKAVETSEPLIEDVVNLIAGWGPDDAIGVFRLLTGELVAMLPGGVLVYQLNFLLDDQLRIVSQ